jgi:amino acid adenylation domain-containing protein
VVAGGATCSYRELQRRANRLAARLRELGAGPEEPIGVCCGRSLETVVAILGVLRAGAAFVPADPAAPADYVAGILGRACARLAVASPDGLEALTAGDVRTVVIDESDEAPGEADGAGPAVSVAAANLAYVMHTSGTTGTPKGVGVEHRQLAAYCWAFVARARLARGAAFALVQPVTVDASLTFVFPPLMTGGCIHIIDLPDAIDPAAMRAYVREHAIDYLKLAPSHLAALDAGQARRLAPRRALIVGGEPASWDALAAVRLENPGLTVLSQYGPTETTVGALVAEPGPDGPDAVCPLGRPLDGVAAHVLDGDLRTVADAPGMLHLGGAGVSRGYLGDPARTAEWFVPDPFAATPGARLYRTGDRARALPDGSVDFAGRADDQVKIRGLRVEPMEVRAHLRALPSVLDAVVTVRRTPSAAAELVAHVVTERGGDLSPRNLVEQLRARVPEHLVPARLVVVDRLPLTPHGKVDVAALAALDGAAPTGPAGPAAASAPADVVRALWRELLQLDEARDDDDFFEVGGHSLLATQLVARVHAALGVELPLRTFFTDPTLRTIVDAVESLLEATASRVEPVGSTMAP